MQNYLVNIAEQAALQEQKLKEKMLTAELEPAGFENAMRNMQNEAEIFREANVPLFTKENELGIEYNQIVGAQSVVWEGEELTITQLKLKLQSDDRAEREAVWKAIAERRLADRPALNALDGPLRPLWWPLHRIHDQPDRVVRRPRTTTVRGPILKRAVP